MVRVVRREFPKNNWILRCPHRLLCSWNAIIESGQGGGELNTYTLSWEVAEDERIDYFRVEERIPGTLGRSGESTLIAANAFETQSVTLHREVGRESTEFQVYACTRDLERHQDTCSEAGSVIQGTESSGIGYLGDAYGYCWESEDDLVPDSDGLGSYAKIDLDLYWRHGYAGQAEAYPTGFEVSRRPWTDIVSSGLGYSQSRLRRVQQSSGLVEYESFWKVGITGFKVYNPEQGEYDYSEKLAVRPITPDRVGSWGQSLFSPILVVEDEFLMDESTRCDFQSPRQRYVSRYLIVKAVRLEGPAPFHRVTGSRLFR